MERDRLIREIEGIDRKWDVIIIGGGASGLGAAIESATRGYKTLLLEQDDFAKGTSSRSTKLVHGGVRYLAQGNISLVLEALRERGLRRRPEPRRMPRSQAPWPSPARSYPSASPPRPARSGSCRLRPPRAPDAASRRAPS